MDTHDEPQEEPQAISLHEQQEDEQTSEQNDQNYSHQNPKSSQPSTNDQNNHSFQEQQYQQQYQYQQQQQQQQLHQGQPHKNQQAQDQMEQIVSSTYSRARTVSRIDQENPFLQNLAQESNIIIEVTGYKFQDSNISKYAVFSLIGKDRNGEFEVARRYSDFNQLRQLMIKRWPGCFIPPLPSKKAIGNTDHNFLNERKKYLHTFCNRIAKLGYLYYSVEFQLFLRHKESDITKKLAVLEETQVVSIIEKYKGQFYQLAGQELTENLVSSIQSFHAFLKTSVITLKDQRQTILELTTHRKNTDISLRKFQKYTIQKYETDMLSQYTNGKISDMVYINEEENQELQQIIEDQNQIIEMEPFTLLYDLINHELKDSQVRNNFVLFTLWKCRRFQQNNYCMLVVQAFLDALESKEYYDNRKRQLETTLQEKKSQLSDLTNGKKTLRSIFTKGDANQQKEKLSNDIASLETEIQYNSQLNEIIIGIIGMIEIEKYKKTKAKQYYEVITTVSRLELECIQKQQRLWTIINQISMEKLKKFTERNSSNSVN